MTKMTEIRCAHHTEKLFLKEIWRRCFGDPARFIDFYYEQRFNPEQTLVLVEQKEIAAMLTVIPVCLSKAGQHLAEAGMLYAVATHPDYQQRGLATQLMRFAHEALQRDGKCGSIVVPATRELFDFYRRQGFQEVFYTREAHLTREEIVSLPVAQALECQVSPISPQEYNCRRENLLKVLLEDELYITYQDEEVIYQQKLAQLSGADIYGLTLGKIQGCAAVERSSADRVVIKELIFPDEVLALGVKALAANLQAKEYVIRTPVTVGEELGGAVRPFGMLRLATGMPASLLAPAAERGTLQVGGSKGAMLIQGRGYLGLAFD